MKLARVPDLRSEIFAGETFPTHRGILVPRVSRIPSLAHHMAELRALEAARRHPRSRSKQRGFILFSYSGAPTDSNFAQVVLLLGFNNSGALGTDDSSYHDATASVGAGCSYDSTNFKFGTGALALTGASPVLLFDDSARFALGSGDFTIECWSRPTSLNATRYIMGQVSSSGADVDASFQFRYTSSNKLHCYVFHTGGGAGYVEATGTTTISANTWYHNALVRSGTNIKLFLNGTQEGGDQNISTFTVRDSAYKLGVGAQGEYTSGRFAGQIDEVRMTVGAARYTGNFTSPTAAFPRA